MKKDFSIASIAAGAKGEIETATLLEVNLKKIEITVTNAVNNVKLTVTKIASAEKPAEVTMPSNKIYHYIQIDKVNVTDSDVSKAEIEFQVEKSWITGNNIDENKVTLNRFASGAWSALSTRKTGEDAAYVFYHADSPGLSVFAITAEEKPAPTPTTAVPQATQPAATATPVPTPAPAAPDMTGVYLIVVLIIAAAAYTYRGKLKQVLKIR